MPPTISIIIPHLNQPDYLERCLASLERQAHAGDGAEIIVVDNGSSELPDAVCAAFDGVRLEREEVPGPGPARNRGVAAARGAVLAFIDADCIADEGWLAVIARAFAEPARQIVGGDVRIAYENPGRMTALEAYESVFGYRQKDYIENQHFTATLNMAISRTAFDAVGPFGGIDVAEDRDWGHRAHALGLGMRYLPEMLVYHPARRSFAEIHAKWDRHIGHDFTQHPKGLPGAVRWLLKALAVGVSPLVHGLTPLLSDRLNRPGDRILAVSALFRIRFYRASRMLGLLITNGRSMRFRAWNRK